MTKSKKIITVVGSVIGTLIILTVLGFLFIHSYVPASCETAEVCKICGKVRGEALGHDFTEATCLEPSKCTRCDKENGEALGHSFKDATCEEPKTCVRCGETSGEALGHSYSEATCKEPATCKVCKATKGEKKPHTFTEATCTEPKKCKVCGTTEGKALGHTTSFGICEKCNEAIGADNFMQAAELEFDTDRMMTGLDNATTMTSYFNALYDYCVDAQSMIPTLEKAIALCGDTPELSKLKSLYQEAIDKTPKVEVVGRDNFERVANSIRDYMLVKKKMYEEVKNIVDTYFPQ